MGLNPLSNDAYVSVINGRFATYPCHSGHSTRPVISITMFLLIIIICFVLVIK